MRISSADGLLVTRGHVSNTPSQSKESITVGRARPVVVVFMAGATPEIRGAFLEAGADFCLDEVTGYEKMEQITRGMEAKDQQAA
jgi:hypothetical protein